MHHLTLFAALFSLTACNSPADEATSGGDSDHDGLSDSEESDLGSDPELPDTDGDGLSDLEEMNFGTDPTISDSDEDTYNDFNELFAGTDPLDPEDRIYKGYWPYSPNKESIFDPGMDGNAMEEGQTLARFSFIDQYGEYVDIYDFAFQGKPILMDISAGWCGPCNEMAAWLDGQSSDYDAYVQYYPWLAELPGLIESGEVYWVTVLADDFDYYDGENDAYQDSSEQWFGYYPSEHIPVLAAEDQCVDILNYAELMYFPSVLLIEEDMTVSVWEYDDYFAALQEIADRFGL